jgi:hypothetical protein
MVAAVAVMGLGATLATATPASAGTSIGWTKTTDAAPGGEAKFTNNGDIITVCDVESDGWGVYVAVKSLSGKYWGYATDGGNDGRCQVKSFSKIPEGEKVRFEICLSKTNSYAEYCRYSPVGRA